MGTSSLSDLINAITARSSLIDESLADDDRAELSSLFMDSIRKTKREIRYSEKRSFGNKAPDDFSDLVVVNLIILGAEEGYSAEEMRDFVMDLKSDDDNHGLLD